MKLPRLLSIMLFTAALAVSSVSYGQVKVGTNPTTIEPTSNLEVEASTAGRKVKIDKTTGQLTISDGTQGAGKTLTSDANGVASWQTKASQRIPETVFIGQQDPTPYIITNNAGPNTLKDRIPFTPSPGSLPGGWNPTTKQYSILEAGYYRLHAGAFLLGTLPPPRTTLARFVLFANGLNPLNDFDNVSTSAGPVLSVFWEGYYNAGDLINVYVQSIDQGGPAQNIRVTDAFLSVTKLF